VLKLTEAAGRLAAVDPTELGLLLSDLPPNEGRALGASISPRCASASLRSDMRQHLQRL
jgi:hypothetical protein